MNGGGFFLGTHQPGWLARVEVPLMVSHRTLHARRRLPRARCRWALDSGGFTELSLHGGWQTTPAAYADAVARYQAEIGRLAWASPQDWMCEPAMLARTGRSVDQHQALTVDNYCLLRQLAPHLPFIPVVQGWAWATTWPASTGTPPRVWTWPRCRWWGWAVCAAARPPARSARSPMSWPGQGCGCTATGSSAAGWPATPTTSPVPTRWPGPTTPATGPPLAGCTRHRNCANCPRYALAWRAQVLADLDGPRQLRLEGA